MPGGIPGGHGVARQLPVCKELRGHDKMKKKI